MLRSSCWRRLLRDVYAHRDMPLDHRALCRAAVLVLPEGAAIGGLSAAFLWGFEFRTDRVSVVVPRDLGIRLDHRLSVHHTTIAGGDRTIHDGMPVTTPERTAFDLGRRLPRSDALPLLDAMLHRHVLRRDVLHAMTLERRAWPGSIGLLDLLALADPRAESPMESRLRLMIADARLPPPVPQFEIRLPSGRLLARADLAWPESGVIAEYDGDHHRDPAQFRRDVARLNAIRMAGWTVLRFTADDVLRAPQHIVVTVSAALAEAADRRSPARQHFIQETW
jgi:very-short-patch-repair endonuclease